FSVDVAYNGNDFSLEADGNGNVVINEIEDTPFFPGRIHQQLDPPQPNYKVVKLDASELSKEKGPPPSINKPVLGDWMMVGTPRQPTQETKTTLTPTPTPKPRAPAARQTYCVCNAVICGGAPVTVPDIQLWTGTKQACIDQ